MVACSVIVPLYNKAPYIVRALDSIVAQTFQDYEVIVVDDGSSDGGGALAAAYPDPRVRVVTQANSGPGAARNRGIAEAQGDLIAFLDSDDEWLPEHLTDGVAGLQRQYPRAASFTAGYIVYPTRISTEPMWRERGVTDGVHRVSPETSPYLLSQMLAFMCPWTTVTYREVLRKWGGFYAKNRCVYGEDSFLWLKVLLNEQVAFQLSPRVIQHREASSLSYNLRGPRPLEPMLDDMAEIEAVCPPELRELLKRCCTFRAFKTACVWGYWGNWRQARDLRNRFRTPQDYRIPYYATSLVCSTPVISVLGRFWRAVSQ